MIRPQASATKETSVMRFTPKVKFKKTRNLQLLYYHYLGRSCDRADQWPSWA
jgi:hypothetical protein